MQCRICNAAMSSLFEAQVLGRHQVRYFQCGGCGFICTEKPWWLEEAYQSSAIAGTDTGIVMRNLLLSRRLTVLLHCLFKGEGPFIDLAGGTGLLTRLLRDVGFDMRWSDPYCANLMAAGFEAQPAAGAFTAVTAFEAVEHMEDPLAFIEHALSLSRRRTFIFSTQVYWDARPAPDWWYYAFPTGQHISFFSHETLRTVARRLGLNFCTFDDLHMLTAEPISQSRYKRLLRWTDRGLHWWAARQYQSRVQSDYQLMVERVSALQAAPGSAIHPAA